MKSAIHWKKEIKILGDDFHVPAENVHAIITEVTADGEKNNDVLYERARKKIMSYTRDTCGW